MAVIATCPYCEKPIQHNARPWRSWYDRSRGRCVPMHNQCAELGDLRPCTPR
jgi:hypothetical protein